MSAVYYSDPRPDVHALVNAPGARVLDIGCGEGALGASLKAAGASYLAGVELDPSAAAVARSKLELLIEGSAAEVTLPFEEAEFDYLIFADILEHVPDPDYVLNRYLPFLRSSGHVIVSVPNWRFYAVLVRLVLDRWEYTDSGVRDRTHLRVFTRYSLEQFLARNALTLEVLRRNTRLIEDQSHIGRLGALATRLSNATLARSACRELLAYQYVALARKT